MVKDTNIYVGTNNGGGVYRYSNNLKYWSRMGFGLPQEAILSIAVSDSDIFANASTHGIYRFIDSSKSWVTLPSSPVRITTMNLLSDTNLFVGTYDGNIYLSTDKGLSWSNPQIIKVW